VASTSAIISSRTKRDSSAFIAGGLALLGLNPR